MGSQFKFGRKKNKTNLQFIGRNYPLADFEPARANRFIVYFIGADIPSHASHNYAFYYENDNIMLEINFYDFVGFIFNPRDASFISDIVIDFLDPVGVVYGTLRATVIECLEFEKRGDYSSNEITNNRAKFLVSIL